VGNLTAKNKLGYGLITAVFIAINIGVYGYGGYFLMFLVNLIYGCVGLLLFLALVISLIDNYESHSPPKDKSYKYIKDTLVARKMNKGYECFLRVEN